MKPFVHAFVATIFHSQDLVNRAEFAKIDGARCYPGNSILNAHPPQELLDANHSFPGRFTFKAIGVIDNEFAMRVIAAVRQSLAQDFDAPYELRHTNSQRHVAVTIEPWVESSQQVIEIYAAIRNLDGLVMLM